MIAPTTKAVIRATRTSSPGINCRTSAPAPTIWVIM
jgi:hypothetical protein